MLTHHNFCYTRSFFTDKKEKKHIMMNRVKKVLKLLVIGV